MVKKRNSKKLEWAKELGNIQKMLNNRLTTQEIGDHYNVSRQRIYQVLTKFGLKTTGRHVKNFLRDKEPKYYWLNKTLSMKGVSRKERILALESMDVPDYCPILGIKLNYDGTGIGGKYGAGRNEESPSIDQIIPGKGYSLNNIAIMSWRANRIKNDGTAEEHEAVATWMNNT